MSGDDPTLPGRPRAKSSTTLMLFSILFENACLALGIAEDDAERRDALRVFGQRVFDSGVESASAEARRQRVRAEAAELAARDREEP
jgi:hypothetical protein